MSEQSLRLALRTIATTALPTTLDPRVVVEPAHREQLLAGISRERITGHALAAVERGALELSAAETDALYERHEDQLALDLRLERLLVESAAALDAAHIPYRALKGPVLAHTLYRDPVLRSFGDVDILVPGPAFDAAIDALAPFGFHRRFVEPRAGFDSRFSKGACLERADGMELDLHRTLAPGAYGALLARSDLFKRPTQRFSIAGQAITGLDPELGFVHACFHAALGDDPPRLVPLRDVAELIAAGLDTAAVIDLVTAAGCVAVLQRALDLAVAELGVTLPPALAEWARGYGLTRLDRWALRSYAGGRRSYAGQAAVSLWVMPTFRDRVAFASALAFPSRDYVRAREKGYARRVSRSVHLAREWRPR